jgi:hypothetical protein
MYVLCFIAGLPVSVWIVWFGDFMFICDSVLIARAFALSPRFVVPYVVLYMIVLLLCVLCL